MLNSAERRRWAQDMVANFAGTRYEDKARAHAAQMIAAADLEDIRASIEPGTIAAIAEVVQVIPLVGIIRIRGGKIVSIEHPYDDPLCSRIEREYGIYTAWEWSNDPSAELDCGQLSRLYIGSKERGPEAQYNAYDNTWYELIGRGNHGKKYAFGGTWTSKKCAQGECPEILIKLEAIIMEKRAKADKIALAEARLEAARKRVWAAHQRDNAAAHMRQAAKPAYPGQEDFCINKAAIISALAAQTDAEAELIEAKANSNA